MRLNRKEYGSGRPIVILHGLFGCADNWHAFAEELAASNRVITADLRNHGRSPHSPEFNFRVMAEDVAELIADLGLDRATLIGHSMGGKTAMELSLSRPELVEGLVVIDIAPRRYDPRNETLRDALLSIDPATIESRREAERALGSMVPDRQIQLFLLKNLVRDDDGRFRWQIDLPSISANYDEIWAAIPGSRLYDGPALFVRGSGSDYIADSDMNEIRSLFPEARLATIEGAGHWVQADKPEALREVIEEFLLLGGRRGT